MSSSNTNKRYSRDLKVGAVRLVVDEGKSVAQVAADLGVSPHSLYGWIKAYKNENGDSSAMSAVFPGSGKLKPADEELRRLREENRILRMERDLLKKTLPLFAEVRR